MEIITVPRYPSHNNFAFIQRLDALGYEVRLEVEAPRSDTCKPLPLYTIMKGGEVVWDAVQVDNMLSVIDGKVEYAPTMSFTDMVAYFLSDNIKWPPSEGYHRIRRTSWPEGRHIKRSCGGMALVDEDGHDNSDGLYNPSHDDVFATDWIIYS